MVRTIINVLMVCAVLAPDVTARDRFRRQELPQCGASDACNLNNEDSCCQAHFRCCDRRSSKEGRCPRLPVDKRDGLMKCLFDEDCPDKQKCCDQKLRCWMVLNQYSECPRYRSALVRCRLCNALGENRTTTNDDTEACCPDGYPSNSGVCRVAFIPPPLPASGDESADLAPQQPEQ